MTVTPGLTCNRTINCRHTHPVAPRANRPNPPNSHSPRRPPQPPTAAAHMSVLVYRGEGAGPRSVQSTTATLQRLLLTLADGPLRAVLPPALAARPQVATLSAAGLLEGSWTQQAAVLVMPGGADLPYVRALSGRGNELIRGFVQAGGAYLGLCAGGYFAASRVEFEPGTPLEVVGDRELAFFPGVARGAAFPGFDYQTEAGAVAARMEFRVHPLLAAHQAASDATGAGGSSEWVTMRDYVNGGPVLCSLDGGAVEQLPGVTVLARYCEAAPDAAAAHAGEQQQQHQRRIAAVRCRVGQGIAVLCGSHPELGVEWLDPCGESNARQGPGQQQEQGSTVAAACRDARLAAHTQSLQRQLAASQAQRDLFLSSLLLEALMV